MTKNNKKYVIAFIIDITIRKNIQLELEAKSNQMRKMTEELRQNNTQLEKRVKDRTLILEEALQELESSKRELSESLEKEKELKEKEVVFGKKWQKSFAKFDQNMSMWKTLC